MVAIDDDSGVSMLAIIIEAIGIDPDGWMCAKTLRSNRAFEGRSFSVTRDRTGGWRTSQPKQNMLKHCCLLAGALLRPPGTVSE
jgi:hypothetical protein